MLEAFGIVLFVFMVVMIVATQTAGRIDWDDAEDPDPDNTLEDE